MAGTIKLKRSAVAGRAPGVGDMALGELAVNTNDGKAFLRGNNGTDFVREFGVKDDQGNLLATSFIQSFQSVTSSAGTTTLVNTSASLVQVTGTATHTIRLPDATTLKVGRPFTVLNRATDIVTVQNSSGTPLGTLLSNTSATYRVTSIATPAGTWDIDLGGAAASGNGAGELNYITNPQGVTGIVGWNTFSTTLTNGIPSATPTLNPATPAFAARSVKTNVLSGSSALQMDLINAAAAATPGQGIITDPFTINDKHLARILSALIDYKLVAGVPAALSGYGINVYLYNVGADSWIQPTGFDSIRAQNGTTPPMSFQSDSRNTTNFNQYRLAIIATSASTGTFTLNFEAQVSPTKSVIASLATDTVQDTFVIGGSTTAPIGGGTVVQNRRYRIVGDTGEVSFEYSSTAAATNVGSGLYLFPLPPGWSVHPSVKFNTAASATAPTAGATVLGDGYAKYLPITGANAYIKVFAYNATTLIIAAPNADPAATASGSDLRNVGSAWTQFTTTGGIEYNFTARFLLAGKNAGSVIPASESSEGRVVVARSKLLTSITGIAGNGAQYTVPFNSIDFDTHGGFNTAGVYTVRVPGWYSCEYSVEFSAFTAGAYVRVRLQKNGIDLNENYTYTSTGQPGMTLSPAAEKVWCNAGDTLRVQAGTNSATYNIGGGLPWNRFNVSRLSGSQAIAPSESVNMRATTAAGQSIPNATITIVNFGTIEYDSHNAVTTGAGWRFTAPVRGKYRVTSLIMLNDTTAMSGGNEYFDYVVYKNGASYTNLNTRRPYAGELYPAQQGSTTIPMEAGDYIDLRAYQQSGFAVALYPTAALNWVCVERVGN